MRDLDALAAHAGTVAYYRTKVIVDVEAWDYGFIATKSCTTCWMYAPSDTETVVLDAGCPITELSFPGDRPTAGSLAEQVQSALESTRSDDKQRCRDELAVIGEIYATWSEGRARTDMSDKDLNALQEVVGPYPNDEPAYTADHYYDYTPRPPFVADGVTGMVRIGVQTRPSDMSGIVHTRALDAKTWEMLTDWATAPYEIELAVDGPWSYFDVFIDGEQVEPQLQPDAAPAQFSTVWNASRARDFGLYRVFQAICTGPLHVRRSAN